MKPATSKELLKITIDALMHPRKYDYVINAPGQFDAAVYLYKNHADELPEKVWKKVEEVLLRSGRYARTKDITFTPCNEPVFSMYIKAA